MTDRPSTSTPFLRRWFGNERQRELDETAALHAEVHAWERSFTETLTTVGLRICRRYSGLPDEVREQIIEATVALLDMEDIFDPVPPPDFRRMSLEDFVAYRNLLHKRLYFHRNREANVNEIVESIQSCLDLIVDELPQLEAPSPFTIPLINTMVDAGDLIERLYRRVNTLGQSGFFDSTIEQLNANVCRASGFEPNAATSKRIIHASENRLPPLELLDAYCKHTVFHDLLLTPVPLRLSQQDRFNHWHLLGGTGHGKTTLIEQMIHYDLQSEQPPSLVVIDPHGDLIKRLARADLGIDDKLIVIDPRDIGYPPAVNVFAVNQNRLSSYDEATREQVTAGVIDTFDYLFDGIFGADLTAKQGVPFRYLARLMLMLPESHGRNATILDMLHLMENTAPYEAAIDLLPPIPRNFFRKDFNLQTFKQTKEQIRYRLQAVIENPTLARLFTATDTKVDFFEELNRGSVILIDTARDFLKGGSSIFGRIMISLVMQAIFERAAIEERDRHPTFLIVDEAGSFFDGNIDNLLTDARKYRAGLVLGHQYLDQAPAKLRASLAANTGIKFAGGLSASDARSMASEMRTTPDFIASQKRLSFAAYIRGTTPHAVSVPIAPLTKLPERDEEAHQAFIERNRTRISIPRAITSDSINPTKTHDDPGEDASEW